eukprot:1499219-Prymnesium_polylepis.1
MGSKTSRSDRTHQTFSGWRSDLSPVKSGTIKAVTSVIGRSQAETQSTDVRGQPIVGVTSSLSECSRRVIT